MSIKLITCTQNSRNSNKKKQPVYNKSANYLCCNKIQKTKNITSFKSNIFSTDFSLINSLFGEKEKDRILTKNQIEEKFKKNKLKNFLELTYLCSKDNGYSDKLSDIIVELHQKTKSINDTHRLFKWCLHGDFNYKIYSDMKSFFDKKKPIEVIAGTFKAATFYGHNKYNPDVTQFAMKYADSCNKKDFETLMLCSLNNDNGYFSQNHFLLLLNLLKKHNFSIQKIENTILLNHFDKKDITKETEKQIKTLYKLGLDNTQVSKIIGHCEYPKLSLLKTLTKELPEIQDKQKLTDFIYYRLSATKSGYPANLKQDNFEVFNQIASKYALKISPDNDSDYEQNLKSIMQLTKSLSCKSTQEKKETLNVIFDAMNYLSLDKIEKIFSKNNINQFKNLYRIYNKLQPKDRKDFEAISSILLSSYSKLCFITDFEKIYSKYSEKKPALFLCKIIDKSRKDAGITDNKVFQNRLNYALNETTNDEEKLLLSLSLIKDMPLTQYKAKINALNYLYDNGFSAENLKYDKLTQKGLWNEDNTNIYDENWAKKAVKLEKMNVPQSYIYKFLDKKLTDDELEQLIAIRDEALNRRDLFNDELSTVEINRTFFDNPQNTLGLLKILGKQGVINAFCDGIDNFEFYLEFIGEMNQIAKIKLTEKSKDLYNLYQQLLKQTNPSISDEYNELENIIKYLKKDLKNFTDKNNSSEEKQNLIKKINNKTREKRQLIENAIKNPQDKLDLANMFFSILHSGYEDYDDLIDNQNIYDKLVNEEKFQKNISRLKKIFSGSYFNIKTELSKKQFYNELNNVLGKIYLGKNISQETLNKLNLTKSKYFFNLFYTDGEFIDSFSEFLQFLEKHKSESPQEAFEKMKRNIETRKAFEENGLNYDNWIKPMKETLTLNIKLDKSKSKNAVLRNLESDLNDTCMDKIPSKIKESLFKKLEIAGYKTNLVNTQTDLSPNYIKLYKDNKPITFDDIHDIISIIKKEMNENEFWNTESSNIDIDNAKNTLKNHLLKLRSNELKRIESGKFTQGRTIKIQKADMNDISHSLFLGNDASCCTAIGTGCNSWTAPNYITNKMISCIELKDGDNFIGNTMIFVAKINNKPALILDNIELKGPYQYIDLVRDKIFDFAQLIAKDIGNKKMPIYVGPYRHKVNVENFKRVNEKFNIMGYSNNLYLDFHSFVHTGNFTPETVFTSNLYKVR